jgi:four helix bundle protein
MASEGESTTRAAPAFRNLTTWKLAKEVAVEIYVLTAKGPIARDFGLRDQLRAAAVSIPSNIAEGDERGSNRDCVRFFHIAKGSVAELRTQLEIAREVSLLDQATYDALEAKLDRLARMLGSLIKARSTIDP